jgi:ATP-binding cassette, subfamily B, bacterial
MSAAPLNPARRALRDLPRLVASAIRLAWTAAPVELSVAAGLQLLIGAGIAAQLLVGRNVLAGFLTATHSGHGLESLIPGVLLLGVLTAAISFASEALTEQQRLLGELVTRDVNQRLVAAAAAADLVTFESPDFQDRLQRAVASAGSRPLQLVAGVLRITGAAISAAAIAAALLLIEPVLVGLLVLACGPLWFGTTRSSRAFYAFAWRTTSAERLRSYLFKLLTSGAAAQELRAFGSARVLADRYARLSEERTHELRRLIRTRLALGLLGTLASYGLTAAIVGALAYLALTGRVATVPALASIPAVILLTQRLQYLSFGATSLYEGALFMDDLSSFLQPESGVSGADQEGRLEPLATLSVENVTFTYPGARRPALDEVTIAVHRGEVVALVGENGSGKTTLAKLLAGLYQAGSGTIRWNGVDLASLGPGSLRSSVAVLFQDFVHYMLSARENIGVGQVASLDDLAAITTAAEMAGADTFLSGLPDSYDTTLASEFVGGTGLSGGQWQRVALARALIREADLLILDEPTAAVDARSEADIFALIRKLGRDRATILISHRFSTVRSADRIYVLQKGRIAEVGTHDQLILIDGLYAELYRLQARGYQYQEPVIAPGEDVPDANGSDVPLRGSRGRRTLHPNGTRGDGIAPPGLREADAAASRTPAAHDPLQPPLRGR